MICRPVKPSVFLEEKLSCLPKGRALDLACGSGRNAIFLAQKGCHVDAVDRSPEALEEGRKLAVSAGVRVDFIEADLEAFSISEKSYDLIINFNYLERTLVPEIIAALKPGGMLIFETFTVDQKNFGPPENELYLLKRGELKELFKELDILYFWEGVTKEEEKKKAVARLLAMKAIHR